MEWTGWTTFFVDALWVAMSLAVLLNGRLPLTPAGRGLVILVADVVAVFAVLQLRALGAAPDHPNPARGRFLARGYPLGAAARGRKARPPPEKPGPGGARLAPARCLPGSGGPESAAGGSPRERSDSSGDAVRAAPRGPAQASRSGPCGPLAAAPSGRARA